MNSHDPSCKAPVVSVRSVGKIFPVYDRPLDRLTRPILNLFRTVARSAPVSPRHFEALQDVSFDIAPGETVGIIGRNGCGKSTLLQIIVGTLESSSGEVRRNGRFSALLELGAGFNPEFTGRDNVILAGAIVGLSSAQMQHLMPMIESFADIGDFIDRPVKTYSSGMFVRLAFSVAIHVEPDVLVVDEALAVGDTAFQTKCLTRIRKMQASGVSIILVTHSTNTLLEYCDRGIYLKRGQLILDGPCREVVKRYADDLVDEEGGAVIYLDEHPDPESTAPEKAAVIQPEAVNQPAVASEVLAVEIRDESGRQVNTFEYASKVKISVRILLHETIDMPCFGVQLKSVDDIALWAGTTQNMGLDVSALAPGEYVFDWDLTLNVAGGRYVVAVGIGDIDDGEYHRHSRVPYAGHIDVLPVAHMGHGWLAVDPKFGRPVAV